MGGVGCLQAVLPPGDRLKHPQGLPPEPIPPCHSCPLGATPIPWGPLHNLVACGLCLWLAVLLDYAISPIPSAACHNACIWWQPTASKAPKRGKAQAETTCGDEGSIKGYTQMKVGDLRKALAERDADTKGNKAALVQRMVELEGEGTAKQPKRRKQ